MIGFLTDETSFNQFSNLDSIDMRIINYLRDTECEEVERIWKLLRYSTIRALFEKPLTKEEKNSLIYRDEDQMTKRVFNFPLVEDTITDTCSILKVYIHSIEPTTHLTAKVNIEIDILSHNNLTNVYNDESDLLDGGREIEEKIITKNRNNILLKSILKVLNGANIEGVGMLQFNMELTKESKVQNRLNNQDNFYGYSLVMSCIMSDLNGAMNGF